MSRMDCPACGRAQRMWELRCASCGKTTLACSGCHDRRAAGRILAEHRATCESAQVAGPAVTSDVLRRAAAAGGEIGYAAKGPGGAALGTVLGAALGVFTDHVLKKPEVQPLARAARSLYGIFTDARRHFKRGGD